MGLVACVYFKMMRGENEIIILTNLVNVYFSCYPLSNNQRVLIYNLIMIVTVKSGTTSRFFSNNLFVSHNHASVASNKTQLNGAVKIK